MGLNQDNGVWKLVWGLSVPNKVKNFLWRACQNAMPAKVNLRKWMILTFDICDHYNREPKSILHALWDCTELAQICEALPEFNFHRSHYFSNISNSYYMHSGKEKIWRSWQCCYGQSGIAGIKSESKTLITRYHRLPQWHCKHSTILVEQTSQPLHRCLPIHPHESDGYLLPQIL